MSDQLNYLNVFQIEYNNFFVELGLNNLKNTLRIE
jgi:hypothetical protein